MHGDYDVDGICGDGARGRLVGYARPARTSCGTCRAGSRRATALSGETIERLAEQGIGLVVTVDCGITAVQEVARREGARAST